MQRYCLNYSLALFFLLSFTLPDFFPDYVELKFTAFDIALQNNLIYEKQISLLTHPFHAIPDRTHSQIQ